MEESFNHVETVIDQFLAQFDPNRYLFLDVLYRFEEEDLEPIISALEHCKLPKRYTSYIDVLHEKFANKVDLNASDLFLYTDNEIYIKRYFQVTLPENCTDRRACGIPLETLASYKKQFFPNDEHKERLIALLPFAIESTLNIKKINPMEFKNLFIPTFVNLADIVVIESSELEDLRSIRGLSYFILREVFEDMMMLIAENILLHFSNQEKKAIDFLSHFGIHETIDAKGNRYKPNPILDESKRAWNMTTIRSTMIQFKKSKQTLYDRRNDIAIIKKKLDHHRSESKEISQQIKKEHENLKEIEEKVEQTRLTLEKLEATDAKEVKFLENGEEKNFDRRSLVAQLYRKEESLLNQKTKLQKSRKELELTLSNKQKEIYVWERRFSETEKSLVILESQGHPIDGQYERIRRALAKTLSQR
jgi:hypothetical protein